jgi:hypothetical protein
MVILAAAAELASCSKQATDFLLAVCLTAAVLCLRCSPVPGAVVLISGCVDDFLEPATGGISATTNATGVAALVEGQANAIQYC